MGYLQAAEFAAHAPLGVAVTWHLTGNHLPPVDRAWIPVAVEAVEAARDEEADRLVDLPANIEYRDGQTKAPAWAIIENFRLEPFVEIIHEDQEEETA
jgi:hypothetical protein